MTVTTMLPGVGSSRVVSGYHTAPIVASVQRQPIASKLGRCAAIVAGGALLCYSCHGSDKSIVFIRQRFLSIPETRARRPYADGAGVQQSFASGRRLPDKRKSLPWKSTKQSQLNNSSCIKTLRRVIFYDVTHPGGLSDRMWIFRNLQIFAIAHHAELAVLPPKDQLSSKHGNAVDVADWWDDYFIVDPPLQNSLVTCCDGGQRMTTVWHPSGRLGLQRSVYLDLHNESRPLCLALNFNFYDLDFRLEDVPTNLDSRRFCESTSSRWSHKTSKCDWLMTVGSGVKSLAEQTVARSSALNAFSGWTVDMPGGWNAVHVRRGDKGGELECTSAKTVVDKMRQHSNSTNIWLVMSDADPDWFHEVVWLSKALKLRVVAETMLLKHVRDNYMRYAVLSCLWSRAQFKLSSFKYISYPSCGSVVPQQDGLLMCYGH